MANLNEVPRPKMPRVERITDVQQILPMARRLVSRKFTNMYEGWDIQPGQRVLFVNDSTSDQLVVEALSLAAREKGAHVQNISLEGFVGLKDAVELLDNMFSCNWYPPWVWEAANESDLVLLTAFTKLAYTPKPPMSKSPKFSNVEITADLLVSEHQNYPIELRNLIDEVTWEKLGDCPKISWTDLEGTEITIELGPEEWRQASAHNIRRAGNPYKHPGHLMLPAPSRGINGLLVTSSITFGGPIPRTSLTIEDGRVVKVEGGGKFGERLEQSFEQYADLNTSKGLALQCPGPGIHWLTTMGICTSPKARRSPFFEELSGSARIYAWTYGHRRAGVMHSSIGEGLVSPYQRIIRHVDTYLGTLITERGMAMDKGHLTALDDPRVRRLASRYGEPDALLAEDWIPAVAGVNAP